MCKKTKYKIPNPRIDKCIRKFIYYLNLHLKDIKTISSCCGHGKYPITIICKAKKGCAFDLVSGTLIPRKRNFYKRDKQGHYYIPELIAEGK